MNEDREFFADVGDVGAGDDLPVATCTPAEMPVWGPCTARGSDRAMQAIAAEFFCPEGFA